MAFLAVELSYKCGVFVGTGVLQGSFARVFLSSQHPPWSGAFVRVWRQGTRKYDSPVGLTRVMEWHFSSSLERFLKEL